MSTIKTLIVDDEPLSRERIRTLLQPQPDVEIVGECGNGRQALAAMQSARPDLLFLDVQMPDLDGFGLLNALPASRDNSRLPVVVFVTAYDQYALRAFEVNALDYLLKPFDEERFLHALERARKQVQLASMGQPGIGEQAAPGRRFLSVVRDAQAGAKPVERLVVRSAGRVFFMRTEEIDWIEAASNYVRIHAGADSHLLRETMNGIEGRLDPEKFLRIHRSTIVNIDRVAELQPWFHGDYAVTLRDGTRLTLSRGHRDKLQQFLARA
jgi:two-component system, LytTR family, response regulator